MEKINSVCMKPGFLIKFQFQEDAAWNLVLGIWNLGLPQECESCNLFPKLCNTYKS